MLYTFTPGDGFVLITNTDDSYHRNIIGSIDLDKLTDTELLISKPGFDLQLKISEIDKINGSNPAGTVDAVIAQLRAIMPIGEIQDLADVLQKGNNANAIKIVNLADPTSDQDAVTKKYYTDNLPSPGSTPGLAAVLVVSNDADGNKIVNAADPTDSQDVATKKYVDDNSGGGGITDATNGLHNDSGVAKLGGVLLANTTISGANEQFNIHHLYEFTDHGTPATEQSDLETSSNGINLRVSANGSFASVLTVNAIEIVFYTPDHQYRFMRGDDVTDEATYKPAVFDVDGYLKRLDRWPDSRPYKVYTATLNQSGTDDPVATILENSIGDIVWTRAAAGNYNGTLSGAFTENKTWVVNGVPNSGSALSAEAAKMLTHPIGTDVIKVITSDGVSRLDDNMPDVSVEIRVYN